MVAQVRCTVLVRGTKKNCDKLRKEMEFEKEYIEKDTNHYRMVCTGYFPCDMRLDFSFEDLASEFSVDVSYLFSEYSDQLCEYDEYDNLENFLAFNRLSASGAAYGFEKETGAVDDLKILNDFLCGSEENVTSASEEISWGKAFEALAQYDDQLIRKGKFADQVSVSGFNAASAGFPRIRLAAESGDEYAKTLLDNFAKAKI
jgi:hypothetical protein